MKDTDTKIWERQPSETPKAFNAFQTYMHMPIRDNANPSNNRTLMNVSNKLGYAARGNKPSSSVEVWSATHSWVERSANYDAYMASRAVVVVEESLVRFQQRVIENSTLQIAALNRVINQKIEVMLDVQSEGDDVDSLAIVRLATATRILDDLSRRIGKMPTSYKTEKVEEMDDSIQTFIIGATDD